MDETVCRVEAAGSAMKPQEDKIDERGRVISS